MPSKSMLGTRSVPLLALSPYERPRKQLGPSHHAPSLLRPPRPPSGVGPSLRARTAAGAAGASHDATLSHSLSAPKATFPKLQGVDHPWFGAAGIDQAGAIRAGGLNKLPAWIPVPRLASP